VLLHELRRTSQVRDAAEMLTRAHNARAGERRMTHPAGGGGDDPRPE